MTNRDMVKVPQGATKPGSGEPVAPQPNPVPPTLVPAPETDSALFVDHDPLDSPQLKPMIREDKTKGLRTER